MDDALSKRGFTLTHNQLNEACNVLKLAGVMHQKGRDYSFTSPVFVKVLAAGLQCGLFAPQGETGRSMSTIPTMTTKFTEHLKAAVRDVLASLFAREYCALLGPHSSGKSDVLHLMYRASSKQ